MTVQSLHTVVILGTGLTGLAVGYFLSAQGYHVTLLDHPSWQDGYGTNAADAAPILFGRYRETWRLLQAIGSKPAAQLDRAIPLEFRLPDGRVVSYQSAHLPGTLQWITSLFGFHGLARHDRWKLFSYLEQIWEQAQTLPADLDNRLADEWLASIGQSRNACEHVWSPLSRWLTGNTLERLSAAIFVQQLSTIFLGHTMDARLTYLHGSVEERLITPLKQKLEECGSRILPQTEAPTLRFGPTGINAIRLHNGSLLDAQWYIAALPHQEMLSLLPEHLLTRYAYFAQLDELDGVPEIAVHFTQHSASPSPRLLLLANQPFDQLAITPSGPSELRCRLTATGHPSLMKLCDEELIDLGRTTLHMLLPHINPDKPPPAKIVRHSQAALMLKPGTALRRPIQQSPIPNLLIAGAWTDTGWPANVESAVTSAHRCAKIISGHTSY